MCPLFGDSTVVINYGSFVVTPTLIIVVDLDRIKDSLIIEQEEIRVSIERVANEIEQLDQMIRIHISRNTACLDTGSQN